MGSQPCGTPCTWRDLPAGYTSMSIAHHGPTFQIFRYAWCLQCTCATCLDIQAAARGLAEELGIDCDPRALQGPMTPNHARKLEIPGKFCDSEFVECYRHARGVRVCTGSTCIMSGLQGTSAKGVADAHIWCRLAAYDGPLDPDDDEVFSIQWTSLQQLKQHAASSSSTYTPWLLVEMQRMHWLCDDKILQPQLCRIATST